MIIFILCSFYILWNRVIFLFLCIVSQCKCPRFSGTNHRHSGTNVLEICFLAPSTVLLLYNWTYSSFRSTHSTEVYMDNTFCMSLYKTYNVCFYLHKVGHSAHLQVNNNGTEYKVEGGHYRVNEKFLQFINKISGLWPSLSESYSYVPSSKRSK